MGHFSYNYDMVMGSGMSNMADNGMTMMESNDDHVS
jgi:hypothetical protein